MKRRDFLKVIGAAAATWPLLARAQQPRKDSRRLGVIIATGRTPEYAAAMAAFKKELESLGWKQGGNLLIDEIWSAGSPENARAAAQSIVSANPDVILGQSAAVIEQLRAATHKLPIVFLHVADPVARGFLSNIARPDGNVTGVTNTLPSMGGKWLQLLKEIAPDLSRSAMLINPDNQPGRGELYLRPYESAARSLGIKIVDGEVHDLAGINAIIGKLADGAAGGFIITPDAFFADHSGQMVALANRLRVPAVYPYRYYAAQGGLMSYGVNNVDLFRQAAPYVDRLLRAESPSNLPVQEPTRFQLTINLKTARALGLEVSPTLLATTDEVIE